MKEQSCPHETTVAILKNNHSTMADDIKEIKQNQKEMIVHLSSMKDFIMEALTMHVKEADAKYATKQDHIDNTKKIEELENTHKNSLMWIIALLTSIVLGLIWVVYNNIDKLAK